MSATNPARAVALVAPRRATRLRPAELARPFFAPRYAVVLHNDDVHTFDYVIEVLQRICPHPRPRARQLALEAHQVGRVVIWAGSLEVAELKRDQIRGYGPDRFAKAPVETPLGVTIEPLERPRG